MEKELEKYITEFIVARCSTAFLENEDYLKIQSDDCTKEEILDTALILGYKKGISDMLKMVLRV